ncbi:M24 family metallopeptidase [Natronorarus salvus]|uniref:M24 family metallopeptidase n=1 Tax=Natronorarus salvus TaxID=3117733 RepID=UPI002F26B44C
MREERLDRYLDERELEAVWFAEPASFAWLTGGDNVVSRGERVGVAAAGYTGSGVEVVTDSIEAARLREEELASETTVTEFPWYETTLAEAVRRRSPTPAAADFEVEGMTRIDASTLRQPLSDRDIDGYWSLGRDAAAAVEGVCREVTPETTEREVAASLRGALFAHGIDSPVVLVGGRYRAPRYRHYTPTDVEVGDYALVSVTTERDGLFASLTRTVAFDPPEWLAERHRAAAEVEARALAATRRVGLDDGTAGEVFDAIRAGYADVGWPDEWRHHHQGGAAGFSGREWIARPGGEEAVHLPMAYAWNPTVRGAKGEDTVLVAEEGFEVLTTTDEWPTETVRVGDRDLDRPAIYHAND